ncbi:hypothetical protein [Vibrio barjaei]|uniref:hypothetical protein n=1 Tax=Vibrio barjaei TaxID=1676683 RepID=UPI0022846754|nr:hypothetical protein [Vibrio barjaei]MCY9874606.1 hypothetical protein [Vibrio barjaei]
MVNQKNVQETNVVDFTASVDGTMRQAYRLFKNQREQMLDLRQQLQQAIDAVYRKQNSMAAKGYVAESSEYNLAISLLNDEFVEHCERMDVMSKLMYCTNHPDTIGTGSHCPIVSAVGREYGKVFPNWVELPLEQ